jgi:hypothetical protein
LNASSETAPTMMHSHRSGSTPIRAARRGTKGMTQMLAMPATAVLRPIAVPDTPMRSISRERRGMDRLIPMPTAVTQAMAAAMAATRERSKAACAKGSEEEPCMGAVTINLPLEGGGRPRSGREG